MARDHARVKTTIGGDDDFIGLSDGAQMLYVHLCAHPTLNYAGVADYRPNRLSTLSANWTPERVIELAGELASRPKPFIVIDEVTEEVLIRSFIRNDEILKQPNVAVAMTKAYAAVASRALRGVIVHELRRLVNDSPELVAWTAKASAEPLGALLDKPSVDPSGGALEPPSNPSPNPSEKGFSNPSENPSGKGKSPSPLPSPFPLPPSAPTERATATPPPDAAAINAGTIVAAWCDACTANGVTPSSGQRGQVGKLAAELLKTNDPLLVLAAASQAGAKGYPSIDRELTAMNGRYIPPKPKPRASSSDAAVAAAQALKRGNRQSPNQLALEG